MSKKFALDIKDIKEFNQVQNKPDELRAYLSKHGGIPGVLQRLNVDPQKGLSIENKQDLADREAQYGRNEIPAKPPKAFIVLMWEAVQDTTLVILIICAIISLVLSFVHLPGNEVTEEFKASSEGMFSGNRR
jgi:Ca2+ transporting ATPase